MSSSKKGHLCFHAVRVRVNRMSFLFSYMLQFYHDNRWTDFPKYHSYCHVSILQFCITSCSIIFCLRTVCNKVDMHMHCYNSNITFLSGLSRTLGAVSVKFRSSYYQYKLHNFRSQLTALVKWNLGCILGFK